MFSNLRFFIICNQHLNNLSPFSPFLSVGNWELPISLYRGVSLLYLHNNPLWQITTNVLFKFSVPQTPPFQVSEERRLYFICGLHVYLSALNQTYSSKSPNFSLHVPVSFMGIVFYLYSDKISSDLSPALPISFLNSLPRKF